MMSYIDGLVYYDTIETMHMRVLTAVCVSLSRSTKRAEE